MVQEVEMQLSDGGRRAILVFRAVLLRTLAKGPQASMAYSELGQFPMLDFSILVVV